MCDLGFQTTEDQARKIDEVLKTLPKECAYRKQASLPASMELDEGEKASIDMITTEAIDREGEVVVSKGINSQFFNSNPVVMFAHKYDQLPVGRAAWLKSVPSGIKAKTIFSDATEIARSCWQMTKEGILKGRSIGFLPTKIRAPKPEETQWKNATAIIESSILCEYSVAPIPMNSQALVEAVAKGLTDEATLKKLGLSLPAKKTAPKVNEVALMLKALGMVKIDPEKIAQQVIHAISNRGRV